MNQFLKIWTEIFSPKYAWISIGLLWLVLILVVNPMGNFPLNDDWAYAKSVWALVETGQIKMENWPAMTLVTQICWGGLFGWIFGLSFESLRISTFVSAYLGVYLLYLFVHKMTASNPLSWICTLTLLFSPLYFSLSFTFMTDVHFLCCVLASFYYFFLYDQKNNIFYLLLATLLSCMATLIRQPGLTVPLVYAFVFLFKAGNYTRIIAAFAPLIVTSFSYLMYDRWLHKNLPEIESVGSASDLIFNLFEKNIEVICYHVGSTFLYAGLFLIPILIFLLPKLKRPDYKILLKLSPFILLCSYIIIEAKKFYPMGNILYNLGLGPKLLKDTYWGDNVNPSLNSSQWEWVFILSAIGFTLLLIRFYSQSNGLSISKFKAYISESAKARLILSMILFLVVYIIFLAAIDSYFDRHNLPVIALLMIILSIGYSQKKNKLYKRLSSYMILVIFALLSILATHDYLSWNRARWEAVEYLNKDLGISPKKIDAGFEANAWLKAGPINPFDKNGKSWWFVTEDDYILSFGAIPNYTPIKAFPYDKWLTPSTDSIYINVRSLSSN